MSICKLYLPPQLSPTQGAQQTEQASAQTTEMNRTAVAAAARGISSRADVTHLYGTCSLNKWGNAFEGMSVKGPSSGFRKTGAPLADRVLNVTSMDDVAAGSGNPSGNRSAVSTSVSQGDRGEGVAGSKEALHPTLSEPQLPSHPASQVVPQSSLPSTFLDATDWKEFRAGILASGMPDSLVEDAAGPPINWETHPQGAAGKNDQQAAMRTEPALAGVKESTSLVNASAAGIMRAAERADQNAGLLKTLRTTIAYVPELRHDAASGLASDSDPIDPAEWDFDPASAMSTPSDSERTTTAGGKLASFDLPAENLGSALPSRATNPSPALADARNTADEQRPSDAAANATPPSAKNVRSAATQAAATQTPKSVPQNDKKDASEEWTRTKKTRQITPQMLMESLQNLKKQPLVTFGRFMKIVNGQSSPTNESAMTDQKSGFKKTIESAKMTKGEAPATAQTTTTSFENKTSKNRGFLDFSHLLDDVSFDMGATRTKATNKEHTFVRTNSTQSDASAHSERSSGSNGSADFSETTDSAYGSRDDLSHVDEPATSDTKQSFRQNSIDVYGDFGEQQWEFPDSDKVALELAGNADLMQQIRWTRLEEENAKQAMALMMGNGAIKRSLR